MLASATARSKTPDSRGLLNIAGTRLPGLTSVPAIVKGGWTEAAVPDWRGVVSCDEPLVAVAFLHAGDVIEWCKSERADAENLTVRLALSRYESRGLDVQISFWVGHSARRWRSMLAS